MFCEALEKPVNSNDLLHALIFTLRRLLCNQLDMIYPISLVQKLIACLNLQDENICMQAAWCLTNIAAGRSENVVAIRELGGHIKVVGLLPSAKIGFQEQVFKVNIRSFSVYGF